MNGLNSHVHDGATLTVHVPFAFKKRGGRKLVIAPDVNVLPSRSTSSVDQALVKAIARGFRWRGMLEQGKYSSLSDLARAERISESYVSRILRLTLLSPKIVEAVLNGRQGERLTLETLRGTVPINWAEQEASFQKF